MNFNSRAASNKGERVCESQRLSKTLAEAET
jgi:hypothetical protein